MSDDTRENRSGGMLDRVWDEDAKAFRPSFLAAYGFVLDDAPEEVETPYEPKPGSIPARVLACFGPGEALPAGEIAYRVGLKPARASDALQWLKRKGRVALGDDGRWRIVNPAEGAR